MNSYRHERHIGNKERGAAELFITYVTRVLIGVSVLFRLVHENDPLQISGIETVLYRIY